MAKLHPLVAYLCESGLPLPAVLERVPCPGDAMVESVRQVTMAMRGKLPHEEGLKIARETSLKGADPNLAIFLLAVWARLLTLHHGRATEIQALFRRAMDFKTRDTPSRVWAAARVIEVLAAQVIGNKRRCEEISREIVSLTPPESPEHVFAVLDLALVLVNLGRAGEMDEELAAVTAKRADLRHAIDRIHWVHSLETGHAEKFLAGLPAMEKDDGFSGANASRMKVVRGLATLMQGGRLPEEQMPGELRPLALLLARRPEDALAFIRREPLETLEQYHTSAGVLSFNLIRAELACGRREAARRLLRIRRNIGNLHPFDDYFLARVELLAGNREAAIRHFAAILQSANTHHAEPRLDFEVRLSCELSAGDLMGLMRSAGQPPEAIPVASPVPVEADLPPLCGVRRLVGASVAIEEIRRTVLCFAPLDAPVLITGETGTGKEEVANAIHESGPRAPHAFVAVNCGAIAESLLESELFGHERGAFTGAARARKGIFEEAGRGTVFLDEVGEMPSRLQVALLRVLEAGEVRPVGGNRGRKISCRILAATNADLAALVEQGGFRQDLLFRLRRLEMVIPPLRERREDILPLADHFFSQGRGDARQPQFSEDFKAEIRSRDWPGNARELRNVVEKLRLLNSDKLSYEAADLIAVLARTTVPKGAADAPAGSEGPARVDDRKQDGSAGLIFEGRTAMRRRDRLRELFRRHGKLTRQEIVRALGISGTTVTEDLKALCAEGFIERVEPSPSPRSYYFRLKAPSNAPSSSQDR